MANQANQIPLGGGRSAPASSCPSDKLEAFLKWYDAAPGDDQRKPFEKISGEARAVLQKRQALAKVDSSVPLQKVHDPEIINARLAELKKTFHLVTPAQSVDILPEGFGVSVTYVTVDPQSDCYSTGDGKLALHQHSLHEIARGANLTWDENASRCLDDRSDPHYCHFRAAGTVTGLDNSPMRVMGTVELDLRDGSSTCEEMHAAARRKGKPNANARIEGMRSKILQHAETRARNRAIACMGVRRSYTREELSKPFAIARLTFTGHSEDQELRREFAKMAAAAALGAKQLLFPTQAAQPLYLPGADGSAAPEHGHKPPPVGAVEEESDEPPWASDTFDTTGTDADDLLDAEDA